MRRRNYGYRPKREVYSNNSEREKGYPNETISWTESSSGKIGRGGEIDPSTRKIGKEILEKLKLKFKKFYLNVLIRKANRLLAQVKAGLPDQNLEKSGTESGTDFESLLNKLETLCLTIKDLYHLIDTSAMVGYVMVDANFSEAQELWFRSKYVSEKNEINLKIQDVALVLKTLNRILKELEKITNQDETSPISQLVNRLRSLFANLVLAYTDLVSVSTDSEYNVKRLESNRWKEGKSLIGLSETILSVPVPEDELNKFLNFLETYYDHEDGEYVIGL